MTELSRFSLDYYDSTSSERRKGLGQYFTPRPIRRQIVDRLPWLDSPRVWEPAAGTGEFVQDVLDLYPDAVVDATEIDPSLYDVLRARFSDTGVAVRLADALKEHVPCRYDLVIGNPPYFEASHADHLGAYGHEYDEVVGGRVNTYSLFVKKGLDSLKPGGTLAFVLPPSMNNGAYFDRLRRYVEARGGVRFLKVFDAGQFEGAQQSVMVLIVVKGVANKTYVFERDGAVIYTEDAASLRLAFEGKDTLRSCGFSVKTGQVVWNQHKERLSKDPNHTFLVWSHNIGDGDVVASDRCWQYFDAAVDPGFTPMRGPAILVNRVVGKVNEGKVRAAVVGEEFEFLAENHVNVVTHPDRKDVGWFKRVCDQIRSPETAAVVRRVTGNTQLSKTELERLVPIRND